MGQNPGAQDGTDTVAGRMDHPSIPEPAISGPPMVVGISASKALRMKVEAAANLSYAQGRPPTKKRPQENS